MSTGTGIIDLLLWTWAIGLMIWICREIFLEIQFKLKRWRPMAEITDTTEGKRVVVYDASGRACVDLVVRAAR